jgi:hypothetical protein
MSSREASVVRSNLAVMLVDDRSRRTDTGNMEVLHHRVHWNTLAPDTRQIANISHEDEACEPYV